MYEIWKDDVTVKDFDDYMQSKYDDRSVQDKNNNFNKLLDDRSKMSSVLNDDSIK